MQLKIVKMIDLKELERRLDEALEKETVESLSSWLLDQRKKDNLESFLGNGTYVTKNSLLNFSFSKRTDNSDKVKFTCNCEENSPSGNYDVAA